MGRALAGNTGEGRALEPALMHFHFLRGCQRHRIPECSSLGEITWSGSLEGGERKLQRA